MNPQNPHIKISLALGWIYTAVWAVITLYGVFRMAVGSEQWDVSAMIVLLLIVGVLATLLTQIRNFEKWALWAMITIASFFCWMGYWALKDLFNNRRFKWNLGLVVLIFFYVLNALLIYYLFRSLKAWNAEGGKGFEVILKSPKAETTAMPDRKDVRDDSKNNDNK